MIEISIEICGDHWLNAQQVEQKLQQIAAFGTNPPVVINLNGEGASMTALGITRMIDHWLPKHSKMIRSWSNSVDPVPYQREDQHIASHFFWMAERYWSRPVPDSRHEFRFAAFVGRLTWPRVRLLKDLREKIGNRCLYSLMQQDRAMPKEELYNLERQQDWLADDLDLDTILQGLTSLDGHQVRDQYDPTCNTNLSILDHYHRFDLEIVSETYCHGPAFLPTEKTIRPLLYHKPVMIYAARHFLRHLRDMGFQTWGNYWDESYDELEGPDRWQAMLLQLAILNRDDNWRPRSREFQDILVHNRQQVMKVAQQYRPQ